MTPGAALVAVCAGAAVWCAVPPSVRPIRANDLPVAPGAGVVRPRLLVSVVVALACAVVWGGVAGAVIAVPAGLVAWRLLDRPSRDEVRRTARLADDLPVAVELFAVTLRSGAAPSVALRLVADAVGGPVGEELAALAHRLALGGEPTVVWAELGAHPQLGALGRALGRAHRSGASVVTAAERLGVELRESRRADVEARARSVSTRAAAPLGACFLPAFVLLGIVPMVAGLVRSLGLLG